MAAVALPSTKGRAPTPVSDTLKMIASMTPTLHRETYVYTSLPLETSPRDLVDLLPHIHSLTREAEGLSLLIQRSVAEGNGLKTDESPDLRHIELRVFSSLEGVGLTAAVADALTKHRIPCNMVAGLRHDHVFVPNHKADDAVNILMDVAADAKERLKDAGTGGRK